jgi:type IV secretory pathway VirB10-like protein
VKLRSILAVPVTVLAVVALAAPVWASDDDDGEVGEANPTTPFVQAPAPAPISAPVPPPPAPAVLEAPAAAPPATVAPARKSPNRATRRARKHTPRSKVAARQVRKPVARAAAATQRAVPRGGVQAGAGGMAPGR